MIERYIYVQKEPGKVVPLVVEVAFTEEEKDHGLMFRKSLPENRGMLFVYPNDERLSYWMRDTYIPLTIAFLDAEGYILELHDAKPLDDTSIMSSSHLCRYALEMNQGWFERREIDVGARVLL